MRMARTASGKASLKQALRHIDVKLGNRIRIRRRLMRMNQQTLAKKIGVSFQALQKYEAGENRVSASALLRIARVLEMPISYFFEDLDESEGTATEASAVDHLTLRLARAMSDLPEDVAEAVIKFAQSVTRSRSGQEAARSAERAPQQAAETSQTRGRRKPPHRE